MNQQIKKGDMFSWHGVSVKVLRVSKDETWADTEVSNGGETWTKRQSLPLPDSFVWKQ